MIEGSVIDIDDRVKIIELLHESNHRMTVAEFLFEINSPRPIQDFEALRELAEIIKYLLTVAVHDKDNDFKLIYAIL